MGRECVPASDACGAGTTFDESTGTCVPDVTCAEGTIAVDGECVPDGTVVCASGTMYDEMTGTCVPDITGCAEGTVEVDGECVPFDDTLVGDITEGAEPNDALLETATPTMFDLPSEGGDPVTIGGCITPDDFDGDGVVDPDMDSFRFDVDGPTVLDITIDGKAGLSAGFVVLTTDNELADHGWLRYGIDLTSDGARRKVLLPAAGSYVINTADSRALLTGSPAGGMDTCYFMQISREALPDPVAWPDGDVATGTLGDPVIYSLTGEGEKQLLFATMSDDSPAAGPSLVAFIDGTYVMSASPTDSAANLAIPGIDDGDEVWIVADYTVSFALGDVEYEVEVTNPGTQAVPEDGTATITHGDDVYSFLWFDAAAGDVVRLGFSTGGDNLRMDVVNPDFTAFVANFCGGACDADEQWMQIVEGGTYYVRVYNEDGTVGTDYDVAFQRTHVTPTSLTTGTPVAGSIGTDVDRMFYSFDATGETWVEWQVQNLTGTITDAFLSFYPRDEEGSLDDLVLPADGELTSGAVFERIYAGLGEPLLLVVTDADAPDGDETFDMFVRQVMVEDLGMIAGGSSEARAGEMIEAAAVNRYVAATDEGNLFDLTVTGESGVDVVVEVLDREAQVIEMLDATGGGEAESLVDFVPAAGVIAFRVTEASAAAGQYDVQLDAKLPPYEVTEGTIEFVDICPAAGGSGEVHTMVDDGTGFGADDDGLSETPLDISALGFEFFGVAVDTAIISTNGWLTFDDTYSGDSRFLSRDIPDPDDPNLLVAPWWDDFVGTQVCTLVEADRVVVQWTGDAGLFSRDEAQVQVILHSDGSIDFVYGDDHAATYFVTTIGVENADGSYGIPWTEAPGAGSSLTYSPR